VRSGKLTVAVVVASVLIFLLAGCGSSSSSSSTSDAASAGASDAQSQARVNLARCLRGQGIDVPDPNSSGSPAASQEMRQLAQKYSSTQLNDALNACRSDLAQALPPGAQSPAQQAQRRQQALAYAQCMRSHGVDIADPSTNGVGAGDGLGRALSSVDQNSPAFKSANASCGSLRPAPLVKRG
jgi:hypothetical protein